MMEAAKDSETLGNFYQTTRRYNPEDSHLLVKLLLLDFVVKLIKFVFLSRIEAFHNVYSPSILLW
jgi:hypothetical protein